MPVRMCANGKFRIGDGPCVYDTKAAADRAYAAYLAKQSGKPQRSSSRGSSRKAK